MSSTSPSEPVIKTIKEVKMYNPDNDETRPIQKADFEGTYDIFEDPEIERLRSEGWFTRGIGAKVEFEGRNYDVTVAGNSKLGYVKVEGIQDREVGEDLHGVIRERFLDYFRVAAPFREESEFYDTS